MTASQIIFGMRFLSGMLILEKNIPMASKKNETVSFVLRFTQKIYETESGEHSIQWRGIIKHVQGEDESKFVEFEDAVSFMQQKLADLTLEGIENKSPKEQKGILAKNFELWKKMTLDSPKLVLDVLKDPKKQLSQVQAQVSQMGDSITQRIEERLGQRLDIDEWRASSKSDHKMLVDKIDTLTEQLESLSKTVKKLSSKKK